MVIVIAVVSVFVSTSVAHQLTPRVTSNWSSTAVLWLKPCRSDFIW